MDSDLPSEFDLIIVGTGVVESIIAAAASRIGKRVLHIDSNSYYGGPWASFNLDTVNSLSFESTTGNVDPSNLPTELSNLSLNEQLYPIEKNNPVINIYSKEWHATSSDTEPENLSSNTITRESLLKESRRYNIDLVPKLNFARGDFVELLISSNIARYAEFRSVSRVVTWLNENLEIVPCSRSDVFSSTRVSVIEKRLLMKLLSSCVDGKEEEFKGYENKTFRTFLKDRKLTDNLVHYVLYAIAMSNNETSCSDGVERVKRFLGSLGRFGKTPFLYSMYGSGETSQAFCRMSAVFGGIYALSQNLQGITVDQDKTFKALLCNGRRITASNLVVAYQYLPTDLIGQLTEKEYISRAIFLTDQSIMESESEHLTLLLFPPENGKNACTIIEAGSHTGTCPKNSYLVHMISKQTTNPQEDFKHCVEKLFVNGVNILWSFYFSIPLTVNVFEKQVSSNIFACPGPDLDLDYDNSISEAKEIFNKIYGDLEFLPRAPDPEEIVFEGEEGGGDEAMETEVTTADSQSNDQEQENQFIEGNL